MKLLATRSVPLSQETRDAWNSVGVRFLLRHKGIDHINRIFESHHYDGILNLGCLVLDLDNFEKSVWNRPRTIRSISSPMALRRTLGDYIPIPTINGPHWHKTVGFRGRGKTFHEKILGVCAVMHGDVQEHIQGTEYRVITVGNTVVQASQKEPLPGVGNFNWHWIGVDGIRHNGIIPHIKEAVEHIPGWEYSVLGWDIIDAGRDGVRTIEINTSPGVNQNTAARIVRQIERTCASGTCE